MARERTKLGVLITLIGLFFTVSAGCIEPQIKGSKKISRQEQLKRLQAKQILVPTHGWSIEEMAVAMAKFGYNVINAPQGNDIEKHKKETAVWSAHNIKMLVRPGLPVTDPFDPEDVKQGCEELNRVIRFHAPNPDVLGFVIAWGLFGEGGFPQDYKFTEKARQAFNKYMNTPGLPLPKTPEYGQSGSMRWIKWLEFRMKTLREFRKTFVALAKQHTNKLVGTWSEFYPTLNYGLNMGEAPGADFLYYDSSFGDFTCDQTITFSETHGALQHYKTFEAWRKHELPLMAKGVGGGVIPIGFQFPMRRSDAEDFLAETKVFIDNIEEDYGLRMGPDIREVVDAVGGRTRKPEVALVFHSFAAAALPHGVGKPSLSNALEVLSLYENSTRQIEGSLHQMGIDTRVIPYEWLEDRDLSKYKLVIVPDPMYLTDGMRDNLKKARRVMYCGEYLMAHRDPATAKGGYLDPAGFSAETHLKNGNLRYFKAPGGKLTVAMPKHKLMKDVEFPTDRNYPADQMVVFDPLPEDAKVLLQVSGNPVIIEAESGRVVYVTNRYFYHAWHDDANWLEKAQFAFIRNLLKDSCVNVRVDTPSLCRIKNDSCYDADYVGSVAWNAIGNSSYGVTGYVAWNATNKDLKIKMGDGTNITIPKFGWALVPE